MKKSKTEEVIIIGGGPAGISCAIQLKRCGIKPLVFDKNSGKGMLVYANLVENYPGFPGGIRGKELAKRFLKQFLLEKLSFIKQEVLGLKYKNGLFEIYTGKNIYLSKYLVLATGTKPKLFKDFKIDPTLNNSVSYDIQGLTNKKNKHFVIIGAGDLAFDYSLNLGKMNKVTILNRGDFPKCIPLLYQRAKKIKSIVYYKNAVLKQVNSTGNDKLIIKYNSASGDNYLTADHLILAIGRTAGFDLINNEFKKEFNLLRKSGRLFIIGDAANKQFRQTAIAAGDGIKAAIQIYEKLRSNK